MGLNLLNKECPITDRQLWQTLSSALTVLHRRHPERYGRFSGRFFHPTARVLRVYLWAVFNERPVYWACRRGNWRGVKPPAMLPNQSTMSRRLRHPETARWLQLLLDELQPHEGLQLVRRLDAKPLTVARHSGDEHATFGPFGPAAGTIGRGYKLHAIYGNSNRPLAMAVRPLNQDERNVALELIEQLPGEGYLLGDAFFETNSLYEFASDRGQTLLTPRSRRVATPRPGGWATAVTAGIAWRRSSGWVIPIRSPANCSIPAARSRCGSPTCATSAADSSRCRRGPAATGLRRLSQPNSPSAWREITPSDDSPLHKALTCGAAEGPATPSAGRCRG